MQGIQWSVDIVIDVIWIYDIREDRLDYNRVNVENGDIDLEKRMKLAK